MGISGAISRGAVVGEHAPGRDGHPARHLSRVRPRRLAGCLARRRVLRPPGVLRDARPHPGLCRAGRHAVHARCALRSRTRGARHIPGRRVPPRPVRGEHHPAGAAHGGGRARLDIQPARSRHHSSARRRYGPATFPFHRGWDCSSSARSSSRSWSCRWSGGRHRTPCRRAARRCTRRPVCPTSPPTSSRSAP